MRYTLSQEVLFSKSSAITQYSDFFYSCDFRTFLTCRSIYFKSIFHFIPSHLLMFFVFLVFRSCWSWYDFDKTDQWECIDQSTSTHFTLGIVYFYRVVLPWIMLCAVPEILPTCPLFMAWPSYPCLLSRISRWFSFLQSCNVNEICSFFLYTEPDTSFDLPFIKPITHRWQLVA